MRTAEQQLDEALAIYRRLMVEPETPDEFCMRGRELVSVGNCSGAIGYFSRALQMNPGFGIALFNRGSANNVLGHYSDALADFDRALDVGLDVADLYHNRGISFYHLGLPAEALADLRRALAMSDQESAAQILNTQGFVLHHLGSLDEARRSYIRALELEPALHIARLNLAITCLTMGVWREGWAAYESRWSGAHEATHAAFRRPASSLPQWHGEDTCAGDRLLVYCEQGLGDTLQFSRYLHLAAARFDRVGVICQPSLIGLLRTSFRGNVEIIAAPPSGESAWHWHCPLMSLPLAFAATSSDPPTAVPYLIPTADLVRKWKERLKSVAGDQPKLGLVWAGAATLKEDAKRSIDLARFATLLRTEGVLWVSLQKGPSAAQLVKLPEASAMLDCTDELDDFADTAALVEALDLVISVDTAVAHLAGALAKPIWLLNRSPGEWRWMRGREDSPWYPTMRIFNQRSAGDWDEPLSRVQAALHAKFH